MLSLSQLGLRFRGDELPGVLVGLDAVQADTFVLCAGTEKALAGEIFHQGSAPLLFLPVGGAYRFVNMCPRCDHNLITGPHSLNMIPKI